MFDFFLKFTPFRKVQEFLDGRKQLFVSLATAFVATGTIVANFSEKGMPYLLHVAATPEFAAASLGWIGFFNALKGEKVRDEIAEVKAKVEALPAVVIPPK